MLGAGATVVDGMDKGLGLLMRAAGTMKTIEELGHACSCDRCALIHEIQDWLESEGLVWEHKG